MPSRREFLEGAMAGGTLAFAGASTASAQDSPTAPEPAGVAVLRDAVQLGRRLRQNDITPTDWQDQVEAALRRCSVEDLSSAIGLERLRARARPVTRGASILRVPLHDQLDGDEGSAAKVFFLERGRSDPPHCHFNLVAAHIVLEGRFRVRHYDRVSEDDEGVVLRATRDRVIGPGQATSISDVRENAHWHYAETRGVLLDVHQGRIDPNLPIRRRQMLDVDRGLSLEDGSIRAPKITRSRALRRYG